MPTLKSLLDEPRKLPAVPKVAQQLIQTFSDENADFGEIASQISADPVLSAKLLRLANSAYFHFSRTIASIDDALRMLGFVMVRNLVLGHGMAAAFRGTRGIDLGQFWHYNLYTVGASRWLAAKTRLNADVVFTLGLMHGIGQLHLHAAAPDAMAPIDAKLHVLDPGRAALEKEVLGFHHGDVASELARFWRFPEAVTTALRRVPEPLAGDEFSAPAGCVHLGAWRARGEVHLSSPEAQAAAFPRQVAQQLGLTLEGLDTEMPALAELTEGLSSMLD